MTTRTTRPRVGAAYRGTDGVVRWLRSETRWGYYMLWLDTDSHTWYDAGYLRKDREASWHLVLGEEVPAPQPGTVFQRVGPLGTVSCWLYGGHGIADQRSLTPAPDEEPHR